MPDTRTPNYSTGSGMGDSLKDLLWYERIGFHHVTTSLISIAFLAQKSIDQTDTGTSTGTSINNHRTSSRRTACTAVSFLCGFSISLPVDFV